MGAALAHRGTGRLCIDLQPDGDFLFTSGGLWTAAHYRIPLLIVMFNNRSYFNDEDHQILMARARGRPVENAHIGLRIDDPPVDFAGLARSYGVHGEGPIEDPADLRPALERAVRHVKREHKPALVDVITQSR
jgi:thiamine pyrophosphate-dependent acetolactate synthase large subunit-like protein